MASPRLLITCANASYAANYLQGTDILSEQSHYTVIVDTLNIQPLQQGLGSIVCLNFIASDGYERQLNSTLLSVEDKGIIGANLAQVDSLKRRYQLTLKPRLSLLSTTQHSRIFIDTGLSDILTLLLNDAGYQNSQIQFTLATPLPYLKQCVQAMESNLVFFNRLLRQYGLFYRFDSAASDAAIVISDNNSSSPYLDRGLLQVHHGVGFNPEIAPSQLVSDVAAQGFVGFTQCQYTTQVGTGLASAISQEYRLEGEDLAAHNFAQPVSTSSNEADNVAQSQSLALNRFEQLITLTGNVPDIFAGCSFSLHDTSGINASGDYICVSVEHFCQQPSDETSQDGLTKYHCVVKAIPRGQPYKLPFKDFPPLPMVFSAKVESVTPFATLTDTGEYFTKLGFDEIAKTPLTSSQSLRRLVNYACANQPQATGWHFPLANGAQVLIGCLNNDPSQAYLIGFDMNDDQPSVVNSENSLHNRILSRSGHELRFDDDDIAPTVILQTLAGEHYFELNAHTQAEQYIQWLSRIGSISFHAATDLLFDTEEGNIDVSVGGYQHIDAKNSVGITVEADCTSKQDSLNIQSATQVNHTAKDILLESQGSTSLLTARSLTVTANNAIVWEAAQGNLSISAPQGSTLINTDGNISIEGTGSGDITLFNQNGMIKLDSSGNVELIGSDMLTLDGQMIIFDGSVEYDIESPISASEPSAIQPPTIGRVANFSVAGASLTAPTQDIELEYSYQDGDPVQNAPYTLILKDGTELTGTLDTSGKATLSGMPPGQFTVQYGEDARDYAPIENTTPNPLYGQITPKAAIEMVESGDTSLLSDAADIAAGAGDWLWGTLQGDFNKNPSTSQIVVGTIISMIPVIDQVMDVRDVCANVMLLTDDNETNDTAGWIALALTGIGFVPVIGSAIKGVGKVIIENAGEVLTPALAVLRELGKGDPIKFLRDIDWADLAKQATDLIKEKVIAIKDALDGIISSYSMKLLLPNSAIDSIASMSQKLGEVLPKVELGMQKGMQDLEKKFSKALDEYTGEIPHVGKTGDIKKVKTDQLKAPKGNELKGAKPKLIPMKKYKPPCFTPGPDLAKNFKGGEKALEKEFYKQLKAQQAGINKMTVGEYLSNRKILTDLTDKHGHTKARKMLTKNGNAQASARKKLADEMTDSILESLRNKNIRGKEAISIASKKVKEQMSQLAALHDPDLIAGGKDKIRKLGNKNVNSSLGSQWSKSNRVAGMDSSAQKAFDTIGPNAKMNIELQRCK
ncbi:hypothetical protein KO495_13730 [Colwellia sp. D2M02]|uniref:contractile injection system protein, VgrG/Pvc8 family n=1 Tax=Colwellia sp. D2M02 TaxID=2841562 RepID=UPI001C0983BE|nr:contractile injection system protein, VgrG/Pvc8 family [Colwellia sp. D2M02]MBU2894370.1 hypothetical protein [Colwellia sp. D2M02]